MKRFVIAGLWIVFVAWVLSGCGGKPADQESGAAGSPPASATTAASPPPDLDQGPRAGEAPIDESKVKDGEALFQTKGCSACHGFGKRVSCPDLLGVTKRRTAKWMESQILHPDVMTKQDPTARQLFAQYSLQMPNQGLTPDQARTVIQFLKHKDHEAGEVAEKKEGGK